HADGLTSTKLTKSAFAVGLGMDWGGYMVSIASFLFGFSLSYNHPSRIGVLNSPVLASNLLGYNRHTFRLLLGFLVRPWKRKTLTWLSLECW
ncbi:MAG: hypothetical protein NC911_07300, partial [Candidatus Omnitrophica bacterium]|nr:hypothetical protein [Candidatus Omnitrophota bacterium]